MKYKELPAFETNEFKIGDRVNVYTNDLYSSNSRYMKGHLVDLVNGDSITIRSIGGYWHFKQCRKLEEVKPREWYVIEGHTKYGTGITSDFDPLSLSYNRKLIRVREVLGE